MPISPLCCGAGREQALAAAGASHEIVQVPGSFEIPAAIGLVARTNDRFDGYVALGCVIRGETTHYDHICAESARGLQDLAVRDGLAIGYGILTCENEAQALARAAPKVATTPAPRCAPVSRLSS